MSTQENTTTSPIGPGAIAEPSVKGAPAFSLSTTEWIAIQSYVINALDLPYNFEKFKKSLGSGAPSDLSDFTALIECYDGIHNHCTTWKDDTFPSSVNLATDIHSYAIKAPTYYNPILPLAKKLTDNPNDQEAKDKLSAILVALINSASQYEANAEEVARKVKAFADQTQNDQTILSGPNGDEGLFKYYFERYGSVSQEVIDLNKEIVAQQLVWESANAEYDHDVVVAATTPTYAWIFPFGTIAAAVVAGVYGDKAVKALDRARAAYAKIKELQDKLAADALLMMAINNAQSGMSAISDKLNRALPVIQKIQGVWGAIAGDLQNIVNLIKTDIQDALPIIMDLGVEAALNAWKSVGEEADQYRVNAYITVKS